MSRGTRDLKTLVRSTRSSTDYEEEEEETVGNLSKKVNKLRAFASDDKEIIEQLRAKIEQQRRDLEARNDHISSIQRNFENLSDIYSGDKNQIRQLTADLKEAQDRILQLEAQLKEAEKYNDKLNALSKQYADQVAKTQKAEDLLQEEIKRSLQYKKEIQVLKDTNLRLASSVEELESAIKQAKRSDDLNQKEIAELNAKIIESTTTITQLNNLINEKDVQIVHHKENLRILQNDYLDLQAKLQEGKKVRDENRALSNQHQQLQDQIAELKMKLQSADVENKQLQVSMKRKQKEYDQLVSQNEALVRKLDEIELLNKDRAKETNALVKAHEAEVAQIKSENTQLEARINELLKQIVQLERDKQSLEQEKQMSEVELQSSRRESEYRSAAEIRQLQNVVDRLKMDLERSRKQLAETQKDYSTLKRKFDDSTMEYTAKISELQQALDKMQQDREDQQNGTLSELEYRTKRITELETEMDELATSLTQSLRDNELLKERITSKDAEISQLQGTIKQLEARIAENEQVLNTTRAEMARELEWVAKNKEIQFLDEKKNLERLLEDEKRTSIRLREELESNEKLRLRDGSIIQDLNRDVSMLQEKVQDLTNKLTEQETKWKQEVDNLRADPKIEMLKQREKQLKTTLSKLVHAEEASESALTCMICMKLFEHPVITNCGHAYCEKCLIKRKGAGKTRCQECDAQVQSAAYCQNLDVMCGKFVYRKQNLEALLEACSTSIS